MPHIILFNKPFNVLSQFQDENGRATLKDFLPDYPGFHAAGRLDYDSEGLMLLTNDGTIQHRISDPRQKLQKTYWVQVEGNISDNALQQLRAGLVLKDGKTQAALAEKIDEPALWSRNPPIRERRNIPVSWLSLTIHEGKNRQVRRMTAATGFPTLRLVRASIGEWHIGKLLPGEHVVIELDANHPLVRQQFVQHSPVQKKASRKTPYTTKKPAPETTMPAKKPASRSTKPSLQGSKPGIRRT